MPTSHPTRKRARPAHQRSADIFAALGDETRLALVTTLSAGPPLSIARLTEGHTLTRQAITKHLRTLTRAGLVRPIRHGRETRFELQPAPLESARQSLDRLTHQWSIALNRLKASLETP